MLTYWSIALLIAASPVIAQAPASAPATQPAKDNPLDKMVCKSEDTLGTRLGAHRVCATLREWKEQEEANREAAQMMQGVGAGCPEGSGGAVC